MAREEKDGTESSGRLVVELLRNHFGRSMSQSEAFDALTGFSGKGSAVVNSATGSRLDFGDGSIRFDDWVIIQKRVRQWNDRIYSRRFACCG